MTWALTLPPSSRYEARLQRRARELSGEALKLSALICAPHPDDETLGCGGTLVKKLQAGAVVNVVFMTDGTRSHARFMPPGQMGPLREREAGEALQRLGVQLEPVFLRYEDQRLANHQIEAVARMKEIIETLQPDEIYIPYRHDVTPDHLATWRIIRDAARGSVESCMICEYPVWYWHHWPRIGWPIRFDRSSLRLMRDSFASGFGAKARRDLTTKVYVGDVLAEKRAALQAHASQTMRFQSNPAWPVLADVANGAFLDCFFQPYEFFCRYRYPER